MIFGALLSSRIRTLRVQRVTNPNRGGSCCLRTSSSHASICVSARPAGPAEVSVSARMLCGLTGGPATDLTCLCRPLQAERCRRALSMVLICGFRLHSRTLGLPETRASSASGEKLIQAWFDPSSSRSEGALIYCSVCLDWQRQGRENALLDMQLKSVKPPTPALFQPLISFSLISPWTPSTSFFFFFWSLAPHIYLNVIGVCFVTPPLPPCSGQVLAHLHQSGISTLKSLLLLWRQTKVHGGDWTSEDDMIGSTRWKLSFQWKNPQIIGFKDELKHKLGRRKPPSFVI